MLRTNVQPHAEPRTTHATTPTRQTRPRVLWFTAHRLAPAGRQTVATGAGRFDDRNPWITTLSCTPPRRGGGTLYRRIALSLAQKAAIRARTGHLIRKIEPALRAQ